MPLYLGEKITQTKLTQAHSQFDWARWSKFMDVEKPVMAGHSFGGCLGVSLLDKFTENELNIYWGSRWLPLQTIGSISVKWSCLILRCNVSLSPRSQRAWIKWGDLLAGIHPWKGKIPHPIQFLAINSEEYAFGAEFPMLVEMLGNIEVSNVFLIRTSSFNSPHSLNTHS